MLWKLSLTGLKSRFKDYAVLFSGLTLASAIFYMFMAIATNPEFLKGALKISFQIVQLTFGFGIVLLSLITLVYIVYANSFLLSMRKKDYGMYMILGARNSKVGRLIFLETLVVGVLSLVIGELIGIVLTQGVSQLLISQLGLQIHKFVGFYIPAMLWTLLFFAILFFLAALWNRHKLVKTNVIQLLHEDQKPVKLRMNKTWKLIEAILGLGLLATGYWAMGNYVQLKTNSITIGFFTIVIGSFFVFDSFFTAMVNLLRKNKNFKYKKLNSFTLGQLKFRLTDYTRILSVISLLFALALGAITVGLNFNGVADQSLDANYYDVVIYKRTPEVNRDLKKVSVKSINGLDYKYVLNKKTKDTGGLIYVSKNEIKNANLKYQHSYQKDGQFKYKTLSISADQLKPGAKHYSEEKIQLAWLTPYLSADVKMVSQKQYNAIKVKEGHTELLQVNNFRSNFNNIEKLQNAAVKPFLAGNKYADMMISNNKTAGYRLVSSIASGFEFMGFFLGLAFLAMLASTLMFKVLSGANSDKPRYKMLWKIGTQGKLLKSSIRKEIGVLFALPAVLGIIDVLFGLQFFKSLLPNPYDKIWIPFGIFLALYLIYYLITVKLYEGIVLQKNR